MQKEQLTFAFTITRDELLALSRALDNLQQTIEQGYELEMRAIALMEKWKHEPVVRPLDDEQLRGAV